MTVQRQLFASRQFDQLYRLDIEQREVYRAWNGGRNEQRNRQAHAYEAICLKCCWHSRLCISACCNSGEKGTGFWQKK